MRIKVLGAGSWGTALALLLYNNGHHVSLWSWDRVHVERLMKDGENKSFLPGVSLPPDLLISDHLAGIASAEMVVFSVPSHAVVQVAADAAQYINPNAIIVNTAKGFDPENRQRLSEVIRSLLPENPYATISGPSHAEEVAKNLLTTVVVAGDNDEINQKVQDVFMGSNFRVYTNRDLIGVEVGGAVKNIIALAVGVVDGMRLGDNAKAAILTRGLAEITRLGIAMGACPETFAGLSGLGDLAVTCYSEHSRNRRAGVAIGEGQHWNQVVEDMGMVVEGVYATETTYKLAKDYDVEMPITEQLYHLLYEGRQAQEVIWALMARSKTQEEPK